MDVFPYGKDQNTSWQRTEWCNLSIVFVSFLQDTSTRKSANIWRDGICLCEKPLKSSVELLRLYYTIKDTGKATQVAASIK